MMKRIQIKKHFALVIAVVVILGLTAGVVNAAPAIGIDIGNGN